MVNGSVDDLGIAVERIVDQLQKLKERLATSKGELADLIHLARLVSPPKTANANIYSNLSKEFERRMIDAHYSLLEAEKAVHDAWLRLTEYLESIRGVPVGSRIATVSRRIIELLKPGESRSFTRKLNADLLSRQWHSRAIAPDDISQKMLKYAKFVGFDENLGLSEPSVWLPHINPLYRPGRGGAWEMNCVDCTRACALTIEGTSSVAWGLPSGSNHSEVKNWTGQPLKSTSPKEIQDTLSTLNEGSYAIVITAAASGGHAFLAYNSSLGVKYMDGQTGEFSDWPPPPDFVNHYNDWQVTFREHVSKGVWQWMS